MNKRLRNSEKEKLLDQNYVRSRFDYDPETGRCFWKVAKAEHFLSNGKQKPETIAKRFNKMHPEGSEAFTTNTASGYKQAKLKGNTYALHRVIWLWMTGEWPEDQIDHFNHIRNDNRWTNLIEATSKQNNRNRKLPNNNQSGYMGVYYIPRVKKWIVYLSIDGKQKYLGYASSPEDGWNIRKEAQNKYDYSATHGQKICKTVN